MSEIDWSALQPGDPDPEPFAEGEGCDVFIENADGVQFTCTRPPHDDPHHVSCGYGEPVIPRADSFVFATWTDVAEGEVAAVRLISPDHPKVRAALAAEVSLRDAQR